MAFKPLSVAQLLSTDKKRLALLNAILEDFESETEFKSVLAYIAQSKGIDLPELEGTDFDFLSAIRQLGYRLQAKLLEPLD
ncbi:hypothetical protein NHP21005_00500 [Helicobacter sp. NHP21005]|uniref:hypothetical protein n=1 Tax=Helicobacter felistomachi TaxID=3040201 RepID=UPI0025734CE5|nr:hypothetical protein [Helicobacter sp. NHP21005]BEG56362.1 hypothetical protein NHP21005_00500 [Helicobacter sp. NHP21005]